MDAPDPSDSLHRCEAFVGARIARPRKVRGGLKRGCRTESTACGVCSVPGYCGLRPLGTIRAAALKIPLGDFVPEPLHRFAAV